MQKTIYLCDTCPQPEGEEDSVREIKGGKMHEGRIKGFSQGVEKEMTIHLCDPCHKRLFSYGL